MSDTQEKKPVNRTSGFFLMAIGAIGIATRFITDHAWTTVTILKVGVSAAAFLFGLWTLLRKDPK